MTGVCLDALNLAGAPTIDELRACGADGARLVAFNDDIFFGYQRMLEHAGLTTAVVLASESFPDSDYRSWAGWYAALCTPTYWVLGNEPDGYLLPGSDPSWAMQPEVYAAFWATTAAGIRSLQPEARLCLAGLVAGQPWWLENILPLLDLQPDAVDIHPYGKNEFQAQALIGQYADIAGPDIGLLVLEWHRPASEIPGYTAMLQASTDWSCFFAWHDVGGLGLHDAGGNQKPEYHAFKAATGGQGMRLEEAEKRADWPLGPRWENTPISEWGNGERAGWYTYGIALQKPLPNGQPEVYPLVGANKESFEAIAKAHGFRLIPA